MNVLKRPERMLTYAIRLFTKMHHSTESCGRFSRRICSARRKRRRKKTARKNDLSLANHLCTYQYVDSIIIYELQYTVQLSKLYRWLLQLLWRLPLMVLERYRQIYKLLLLLYHKATQYLGSHRWIDHRSLDYYGNNLHLLQIVAKEERGGGKATKLKWECTF